MMIIFDLDDTLYKEYDYQHSGFKAIARELSDRGLTDEAGALKILTGSGSGAKGLDKLLEHLDREHPNHGVTIADLLEIYRYHEPEIKLDKSTEEVLCILKERGIKLGLITDGRSRTQRLKIKALGLDRYIEDENILISEEVGADKREPLMFETMMARNPNESSYCYIGDNPAKDFYHAKKLGWITVILLDKSSRNVHPQYIEVPTEYCAMMQVSTLKDILPIFQQRKTALCRKA